MTSESLDNECSLQFWHGLLPTFSRISIQQVEVRNDTPSVLSNPHLAPKFNSAISPPPIKPLSPPKVLESAAEHGFYN